MIFRSKGSVYIAFIAMALVLLANVPSVLAHDVIPGVTGFTGRVLHPFIITEHMLCLILAGFIAGLYGGASLWRSLSVLLFGLGAGFGAQAVIPIIDVIWMLPLGTALVAGLLIVGAAPIGQIVWLGIIFALGFAVGLETDPEGVFWIDFLQTLAGLMVAGSFLLFGLGWLVKSSRRPWVPILVRVISSWITAISVLVLGLSF